MKTVIMGAGAMGGLFGGLLAFSGEEVWWSDVQKEQVDVINAVGLTLGRGRQASNHRSERHPGYRSIGRRTFVIFFVKTYHTERLSPDALALEKEDTISSHCRRSRERGAPL